MTSGTMMAWLGLTLLRMQVTPPDPQFPDESFTHRFPHKDEAKAVKASRAARAKPSAANVTVQPMTAPDRRAAIDACNSLTATQRLSCPLTAGVKGVETIGQGMRLYLAPRPGASADEVRSTLFCQSSQARLKPSTAQPCSFLDPNVDAIVKAQAGTIVVDLLATGADDSAVSLFQGRVRAAVPGVPEAAPPGVAPDKSKGKKTKPATKGRTPPPHRPE